MDVDGEPIGRGQLDRRSAEGQAFQEAVFATALFTWVVLVNGLLAIFLIELFQTIGCWEAAAVEGVDDATSHVSRQVSLDV